MKKFFVIVCFLAAIFDCLVVTLGFCVATIVKTTPGYIFSIVGALIIVALLVTTSDVWRRDDSVHRVMRIFWALSLLVNFVCVWLGAANHILLHKPISDSTNFTLEAVFMESNLLQIATSCVLTIFLTVAPIGLSYFWKSFYEDDEEDYEHVRATSLPPKVGI